MDYERIDKPQTGLISPSKLRAKLMGVSSQMKKDGSNCNSSRTSPSRLEDSDFVKNSLLAATTEDFDDPVSSSEPSSEKICDQRNASSAENQNHCQPRENTDPCHLKVQQPSSRGDSCSSSVINPSKSNEDDNLDYDSNASSSSFEFHKGERLGHRSLTRSLSRPTSYKWNDAEKWIINKQASQVNQFRNQNVQSGGNRMMGMNMVRVAPEAGSYDYRLPVRVLETKQVDACQAVPIQSNGANVQIDLYHQNKDVPVTPAIRAISMRDMGTEMTPVPSQEPSRTATPVGAISPLRSPISSVPSTPGRGEKSTTLKEGSANNKSDKELSEQELKLKTRREIVALGVQLGKMNIAAWASNDEKERSPLPKDIADFTELERIEFEKRAAAWEEAEKSKHGARFKGEEIKIQAWESQQKAKLEEELRRIEAKVERLRTQSQAKMLKQIATARRLAEDKRAAAEARKKRQAEKTAAKAEHIRQTGRLPASDYACCGLFA